MQVFVCNEAGVQAPLDKHELTALIKSMYMAQPHVLDAQSITIHLVRDQRIIEVNSTHMLCIGPPNVLSFPPDILMLSVDTLRRECVLYGQDVLEHTVRLLAHGLGHILGFDHGEEMNAVCAQMEEAGRKYIEC